MRGRSARAAALALGVLLAGVGCATIRPPTVTDSPGRDPQTAWARVLHDSVLADGRIDFVGLRRDPGDLEVYVAWVADHGPRSTPGLFPTRSARLAYYVNAYNALAMYQVVTTERRPAQHLRFFLLSTLRIDGERRSLYTLENRMIRPLGEPRVHFALNCMVRGCPRLPREPFDPAQLDAQLDRETRHFLGEPRNVQVDPALDIVRVSSILRFYRKDFLAAAPSLIAYVNRYRDEKVPERSRVRFIPYDWTLNER